MRVLFMAGLALAVLGLSEAAAKNPDYHCKKGTVAEDAVTYAYPDVDVDAFSDPDAGICTFSIEGATADGPSSRDDAVPIAEILDRARGGDVDLLVERLLSARAGTERVSGALMKGIATLLAQNPEQLDDCITALEFFDGGRPDPLVASDGQIFIYLSAENNIVTLECGVYAPNAENPVVHSDFPTLRLDSRTGNKSDTLFVPSEALK